MKCEELLTLTGAHVAHVKESLTHFSTNIKLKDALADLSQRFVFDEKIHCDVYVEAAYYATNNGFVQQGPVGGQVPWLSQATRSKDSDRQDKDLVCSCVFQVSERQSW